jgi:DNA invertase Pin-like site-specific DNA recombinase
VKPLIAYYRVSTQRQGQSGLGLEAQKLAVETYAKVTGAIIAREYTEIESGKKSDRPQLKKALAHAKRSQGLLCVAKLDRLSRNVAFLAVLMDSGADFVCCDQPQANRLTLHILVAVAEQEAKAISDRTKAALAAYIARGGRLGASREECRNLTPEAQAMGRKLGSEASRKNADAAYEDLYPVLRERRQAGQTLQEIADWLNAEGYKTRRGKSWERVQVKLVLDRAARLAVV